MRHATPAAAVAAVLLAAAGGVQAQAFDAVRLFSVPVGDGQGLAGVAVVSGHEYLGSDRTETAVWPILTYQWKNGWFAGTGNGVGYKFPSRQNMQYGLRVTLDLGRDANDSAALAGMGDVDIRPEIGGFFNYFITDAWFLTSSIRYGAGNDRNGAQVDVGAGYTAQLAPQWRTTLGMAATYVNSDYMQAYYGVSAAQSASSGYAVYTPGAGWRDVRGTVSLTYFFNTYWSSTVALTLRSLQSGPKGSPIVTESTPLSGLVAVNYSF